MSFPFEQFRKLAEEKGKSVDYIVETLAYAKKLDDGNYPVIFSLTHLAILMGNQSAFLRNMIGEKLGKVNDVSEGVKVKMYNHFYIKKRSKGYREIMAPHQDLRNLQRWINLNILQNYPLQDCCKGFRKGISIKDNALMHEGAEIILKVDLLKFYDTITEKRVFGIFREMGYAKNLSYSLAKICTAKHKMRFWMDMPKKEKAILEKLVTEKPPILPQGAPTSPTLANIVASKLDKRFTAMGKKMGFSYSRYADDLTFSVKGGARLPSLKIIKKIIIEEGFFYNNDKITYMSKGSKQYVTGLTVTNGVHTSKSYRKLIEKHIYFCRKFGVTCHLNRIRSDFPEYNSLKFHDWLYGHICFINSVDKEVSSKLLSDFKKIDWLN